VRADRDQADGPGGADLAGDRGAELPDGLAGVDELREEPAGEAELVDERGVPVSADDVEQARGRRVGALRSLGLELLPPMLGRRKMSAGRGTLAMVRATMAGPGA
jgi:hypothetical protein